MGGPNNKEALLTRKSPFNVFVVIGITIILNLIQLSVFIICPFKLKLREFNPTLYPYHLSNQIRIESLSPNKPRLYIDMGERKTEDYLNISSQVKVRKKREKDLLGKPF